MDTVRVKAKLIFLALVFALISVQGCDLEASEWNVFGSSAPVHTYTAKDICLIDYGASWCGPCRQMKKELPKLKGFCETKYVDTDKLTSQEKKDRGITTIPVLKLIVFDYSTKTWRHIPKDKGFTRWDGFTSANTIKKEVSRVLDQLNSGVVQDTKFVKFEDTPARSFKNKPPQVRVKVPGSGWNEGITACGNKLCFMCYPQYQMEDAAQANCPQSVVDSMLKSLNLKEGDHLLDVGCGDGNILRTAVKDYGCTAIGIEIDPSKVRKALELNEKEGLSDRIVVLTMDAKRFSPEEFGVTVATVYLYPETLLELSSTLKSLPRLASAFHDVPGLSMSKIDNDIYLRDSEFLGSFP